MQDDTERALALAYAPDDGRRAALSALLALDAALGEVVRTTTQPALGQIRLAWWREQLVKLDSQSPPAMPELVALAETVLPRGVSGSALAEIVAGWDVLIEEETLDDAALDRFAAARGGRLFALATRLLGGDADRADRQGQGWALADLSQRLGGERGRRLARRPCTATAPSAGSGCARPRTLRASG